MKRAPAEQARTTPTRRCRSRARGIAIATAAWVGALAITVQSCEWRPNTTLDPPSFPAAQPGTREHAAASATAPAPGPFYAARTQSRRDAAEARARARISIDEEDLAWVSTPQDARVALMVSPETGFASWGVESSVAEIPVGWHTGRHRHGEEAIYIVSGSGYAVVDHTRYDFARGTTIGIPHGAEHQLFNTGRGVVRYVSATARPLEAFTGIDIMEQLEEAGPTRVEPEVPRSSNGYDADGYRIRLPWREAEYRAGEPPFAALRAWLLAGVHLNEPDVDGSPRAYGWKARVATGLGHHDAFVRLMGHGDETDFPNELVLMSGFLVDEPAIHSGKHAHMDAIIYVVQGHGYTVVDGKKVSWAPGTSLHIPGPQTRHQHFFTGSETAYLLRISSGIRPTLEAATRKSFPYLWFEARRPIGQAAAESQ